MTHASASSLTLNEGDMNVESIGSQFDVMSKPLEFTFNACPIAIGKQLILRGENSCTTLSELALAFGASGL